MIGTSLGPYKILEQLGAGGMGEVYLGEDTRLGRKVAIKVLPEAFASDPVRLARFEQEARAAAALNHPHIAVVHDVGAEQADGAGATVHFMVQEHLEGETVRALLARGTPPLKKALDLGAEMAEALAAAHGANIVHRDLKPANVFITPAGHAKVLDFGLAKLTQPEGEAPGASDASRSPTMLGTVAGQVMGTAGYMAPEHGNGGRSISVHFSDSQWIGFYVPAQGQGQAGRLMKVSIDGGAPFELCACAGVGTWGDDDNIYLAMTSGRALARLPGAGGDPEVLWETEEGTFLFRPAALPGSDALLFEIASAPEGRRIAVISLADLAVRELVSEGTDPRYAPTGHIVYGRSDALFAVAFDPVGLEVTGPPTPIVQDVRVSTTGMIPASIAADGTLTYIPGALGTGEEQQWALVWVDRNGREELVTERRGAFRATRMSPDGRRIALEVADANSGSSGIWILGIEDDSFAPLNNEGTSAGPLWTPDSQTVLFNWDDIQSGGTGTPLGGIYARDASFRSEREEILRTDGGTYPISWSGDGEDLVLHEMIEGQQRRRILVVPFVGQDRTPHSPLDPSGQFNQRSPMVSPDGRWVAYVSSQSGRDEVYVRPFPGGGTRVQISNNGGVEPMWGADTRELFYREMAGGGTSRMFSAQLSPDPEMRVTRRTELFTGSYYFMANWARTVYDYDRANDRFLMVDWSGQIDDASNSLKITVVLNWLEELKARVPARQ